MKISNSKKQLAKIIHENGGWRDGYDFASQDGDDYAVWFYDGRPVPGSGRWWKACGRAHCGIEGVGKLPNWHQTILSRDEYFYLYPAPEPVADTAPTPAVEAKLVKLVAAGKELGLVLSVAAPELALSVAPVQKYTGKFYNAELGEAPAYGKNTSDAVCDGCGKRYGEHYGDRCKSSSER